METEGGRPDPSPRRVVHTGVSRSRTNAGSLQHRLMACSHSHWAHSWSLWSPLAWLCLRCAAGRRGPGRRYPVHRRPRRHEGPAKSTIRMLGTAFIPQPHSPQWPSLTLRPCGQVLAQALLWGQGTHKRLELGAAPLQGAEVLRGRHALIPLRRCTFGEGGRRLLARPRGVLFASSVFVRKTRSLPERNWHLREKNLATTPGYAAGAGHEGTRTWAR